MSLVLHDAQDQITGCRYGGNPDLIDEHFILYDGDTVAAVKAYENNRRDCQSADVKIYDVQDYRPLYGIDVVKYVLTV